MSWLPINTPWLTLLPAWIGAKEAAIGDPDARPLLRLHRRLPGAADPLPVAGDDHLEATVPQGVPGEQPLAVDDQPGVGVPGDVLRPVAEADPGRGHGVRVDVVEEIVHPQVVHRQVELSGELPADEVRVLGQEEDPLAGGEADDLGGLGHADSCSVLRCG